MTSRSSSSPGGVNSATKNSANGGGGLPKPNMQPSLPLRTPAGTAPAPSLAPRPALAPRPGAAAPSPTAATPEQQKNSGAVAGRGVSAPGGMAGRRRGMPGLTLSQMGISTSSSSEGGGDDSAESSKPPTAGAAGGGGGGGLKRGLSARTGGMRLPGSSPAGAFSSSGSGSGDAARNSGAGSRRTAGGGGSPTSPGGEGGGGVGASPFSNFRKIVYVLAHSLFLDAPTNRMILPTPRTTGTRPGGSTLRKRRSCTRTASTFRPARVSRSRWTSLNCLKNSARATMAPCKKSSTNRQPSRWHSR